MLVSRLDEVRLGHTRITSLRHSQLVDTGRFTLHAKVLGWFHHLASCKAGHRCRRRLPIRPLAPFQSFRVCSSEGRCD